MSGNSIGSILKLTSFGESHGPSIGGVIEGFPANFPIDLNFIQSFVNRRRASINAFSTSRLELDVVEFLSGIYEGKTLGTPIAFLVRNKESKSADYESLKNVYRPSHADFTWQGKYGFRDHRGGGRSSARETVARVVAGGLALQFLQAIGIEIVASVVSLGDIESQVPISPPLRQTIDAHPVRCVDSIAANEMLKLIDRAKAEKDSLGGNIHCWISGVPVGLGEPVFDKLQARLAAAMMSINTAKGFSYGNGFRASKMRGSSHNDVFISENEVIRTVENKAGGLLGGISTGENIYFTVAFKPIASIGQLQQTVDVEGNTVDIEIEGRHDVTVLPRVVPIVESMAALAILDFWLMQKLNNH